VGKDCEAAANRTAYPDADIATASSRGRILIIHTREDLTIVRETVQGVRTGT
jgi:acetate kinase